MSKNSGLQIQTIVEVFICFLSFILLFPLLMSFVFVVVFVRSIVKLYFLWFTKGKYLLMSPEDAVWACDRPSSYTVITGINVFEGVCDLEKIRTRYTKRFRKRDGFSRKMRLRMTNVFGFYCWEDCRKTFDINKIIKYIDGEKESLYSETEVLERIGRLCDELINPGDDQPQWEFLVVPNFIYDDPKKHGKRCYAIITRIHHSYLDGISVTHTIQNAMGDHYVDSAIDPYKEIKIPIFKKVYAYLIVFFLGPHAFYKTNNLKEKSFFEVDHVIGPKTVGWTNPFRLDVLKKIKSVKGISVTAILNCAVGGALRKLAIENKFRFRLQDTITGANTAAKFPYQYLEPQNKFSIVPFPINMTVESVEDRLNSAQTTAKYLQHSPDFLMHYLNMRIFGLFPSWALKLFIEAANKATYILSNVPGPIEPLNVFDGDLLCDITAWGPVKLAFGLTLFSYNGFIRGAMIYDGMFSSDPKYMKPLLKYFEEEIKEMGKLACIPENEIFRQ